MVGSLHCLSKSGIMVCDDEDVHIITCLSMLNGEVVHMNQFHRGTSIVGFERSQLLLSIGHLTSLARADIFFGFFRHMRPVKSVSEEVQSPIQAKVSNIVMASLQGFFSVRFG